MHFFRLQGRNGGASLLSTLSKTWEQQGMHHREKQVGLKQKEHFAHAACPGLWHSQPHEVTEIRQNT